MNESIGSEIKDSILIALALIVIVALPAIVLNTLTEPEEPEMKIERNEVFTQTTKIKEKAYVIDQDALIGLLAASGRIDEEPFEAGDASRTVEIACMIQVPRGGDYSGLRLDLDECPVRVYIKETYTYQTEED